MDHVPNSEHEQPDETDHIRRVPSDELFWYDAHFGETEPSERMFKSLPVGENSGAYDWSESTQHHSLDDMNSRGHQRSASNFASNRKSDERDDEDDDDIETMKNKLLSAWTNAKNGRQSLNLLNCISASKC